MATLKQWRYGVGIGLVVVGAGFLAAQEATDTTTTTTIVPAGERSMSVKDMAARVGQYVAQMNESFEKLDGRVESARIEQDIIKLDCLNNALLRMKKLLDIAEDALEELDQLVAAGGIEDEQASFRYKKATVAKELAEDVLAEADACAGGEELAYGKGLVESSGPVVIDDPTKDPKDGRGFQPTNPEDPGLGSPF